MTREDAQNLVAEIYNDIITGCRIDPATSPNSPEGARNLLLCAAQLTHATIQAMALPSESLVPELNEEERGEAAKSIQGILGEK